MFNQTRQFLRRKLFSPRRKPKQQGQTTHRMANKRGGSRRGIASTPGGGGNSRNKLILRYALYGAAAGTLLFVANAFLPENRRFFKTGGRIQAREEKPRTTTQATEGSPQDTIDSNLASLGNTTNSQISQEEWKHMLDTTMAIPGIQVNEIENQLVIVAGDTVYVFTTEGHPAHPAVVTRMVYKKDNAIYLGSVGHYSGSRGEFEKWWQHFLELNDQFISDAKKSMGSVLAQDKSPTGVYSKFGKDQREDVRKAEKEKQKNETNKTGKQGEKADTPVHINVKDKSAPSKTPSDVQHAPNAKQPLNTKEVVNPQLHQGVGLSEETKQKIQAAQDLLVKQKLALEVPVSTVPLDDSGPRKGKAEREALEQKLTEEAPVHINVNDDKDPAKTPYDKEHASNAKEPLSTKEVIDPRPPPGAGLSPKGKEKVVAEAKARGIPITSPELTKPKKWQVVEHVPYADIQDAGYVNEKGVSVYTTVPRDQELMK